MSKIIKDKSERKIAGCGKNSRFVNKTLFIVAGILAFAGFVYIYFYQYGNPKPAAAIQVKPDTLPGIQLSEAPWQPELNHLRERLNIIGLPALANEGTALHTHQHLDLYIKGKPVPVPASIGIDELGRFISPIHTHDATGKIHVESPTVQTFSLGQFFDIWGVRFTSKCIGFYCADQQNSIRAFVNGEAVVGDPRKIELRDHIEIVIAYGTSGELPNPIPSHHEFSPGS